MRQGSGGRGGARRGVPRGARPPRIRPEPPHVPVEEIRERMSSYIYGNITVLAAALAVSPHQIDDGAAVWAVLATGVLTFLAHVLAHLVAQGFGETDEEDAPSARGAAARAVVSRARPIATSALIPALVYGAAWAGWIAPVWAQAAAVGILAVRLAFVGVFMQRYSGRKLTMSGLWGGVVLAAVAIGIGVAKLVLTH